MKTIELVAHEFITNYNSGDKEATLRKAKNFAKTIRKDEWQLRNVDNTFALAKAMYFLLRTNDQLTSDESGAIVRLIYYCLLKNFHENKNVQPTNPKYPELIEGCELAFIILCKSGQFLMYQILSGSLGYMPNFAQKHILDQMLLFGGTVKEANEKGYYIFRNNEISIRFQSLLQKVYENIPTGDALEYYKDNCMSSIKNIYKDLENSFHFEEDFELF